MTEICWCGKALVADECPEHGAEWRWPPCGTALSKEIGGTRSCGVGGLHWATADICRSCPVWRMEAALRAVVESLCGDWKFILNEDGRIELMTPPYEYPEMDGAAMVRGMNEAITLARAALAAMEVNCEG